MRANVLLPLLGWLAEPWPSRPQADSRLPYLLRLPLGEGLVLKARERWPATARVYCHRFEEPWPEDAEVVERTPVRLCRRCCV